MRVNMVSAPSSWTVITTATRAETAKDSSRSISGHTLADGLMEPRRRTNPIMEFQKPNATQVILTRNATTASTAMGWKSPYEIMTIRREVAPTIDPRVRHARRMRRNVRCSAEVAEPVETRSTSAANSTWVFPDIDELPYFSTMLHFSCGNQRQTLLQVAGSRAKCALETAHIST